MMVDNPGMTVFSSCSLLHLDFFFLGAMPVPPSPPGDPTSPAFLAIISCNLEAAEQKVGISCATIHSKTSFLERSLKSLLETQTKRILHWKYLSRQDASHIHG